jgi:hypothetical protein
MGWNFGGRVALVAVGLAGAAAALLSVGCEDGPFLQSEQFVTRDGQDEEQFGSACIPVQKGSGVRRVITNSSGKTLAERNYDAAFVDAGRKDELKVEIDGETLRFVGRGVAACGK